VIDFAPDAWRPLSSAVGQAADLADLADRVGGADPRVESLDASLLAQIDDRRLGPELVSACRAVVASLDPSGYLRDSPEEVASWLGVPASRIEAALRLIQALEPAGVGARSLAECLHLQLARVPGPAGRLAERIVADHLEALAGNRPDRVAAALRQPIAAVIAAFDLIRSLTPRPGAGFGRSLAPLVVPDLVVRMVAGARVVALGAASAGGVTLSRTMIDLRGRKDLDPATRAWLEERFRAARQLRQAVEARQTTLLRLGNTLLEAQAAFFAHGPAFLRNLRMAELARALDLHPSTVSRAVKGKRLQCQWGCFPLAEMFNASRSATDVGGVTTVKTLIKELIEGESRLQPLTDQAIVLALERRGAHLSRRTVARYREELGIPPRPARRY
jgi:RNA polymerase sigma-54 factor